MEEELSMQINKLTKEIYSDKTIPLAPSGRLSLFTYELAINLYFQKKHPHDLNVDAWLEKVRRFIELNKSNLIKISISRFDEKDLNVSLESMATLMSLIAFSNQNILYFNAACRISDAIDIHYGKKPWTNPEAVIFVKKLVSFPSFFIGKSYEA